MILLRRLAYLLAIIYGVAAIVSSLNTFKDVRKMPFLSLKISLTAVIILMIMMGLMCIFAGSIVLFADLCGYTLVL